MTWRADPLFLSPAPVCRYHPATAARRGSTRPRLRPAPMIDAKPAYPLKDPATLADPHPLYHRMRREDPVH